jgi:DNA-binding transcriptional regulator PaaX
MDIIKLRRNSKPHKLISALLIGGGFLVVSAISPLAGAQIARGLMKEYFRKKRFEKEKFLRDLKRLQKRELINYKELPDGKIEIVLTKRGQKLELVYKLDDLKLDTKKKWDGQWRMVMFDIPHFLKNARDAFRGKLRTLGFYPIQKSVFITPYKCEKEIDFICSVFGIRDYVLIFNIQRFEGEEKLRHYFKI